MITVEDLEEYKKVMYSDDIIVGDRYIYIMVDMMPLKMEILPPPIWYLSWVTNMK